MTTQILIVLLVCAFVGGALTMLWALLIIEAHALARPGAKLEIAVRMAQEAADQMGGAQ